MVDGDDFADHLSFERMLELEEAHVYDGVEMLLDAHPTIEDGRAPRDSVHPRPSTSEPAPGGGYPPPLATRPQEPGRTREEK